MNKNEFCFVYSRYSNWKGQVRLSNHTPRGYLSYLKFGRSLLSSNIHIKSILLWFLGLISSVQILVRKLGATLSSGSFLTIHPFKLVVRILPLDSVLLVQIIIPSIRIVISWWQKKQCGLNVPDPRTPLNFCLINRSFVPGYPSSSASGDKFSLR